MGLLTLLSPQVSVSFRDLFDRSDAPVGNGWIGSSWVIASGFVGNTPVATNERLVNPGAEGTYTAGLAANWTKLGTNLTISEEGMIIHGGAKAQKVVGGTTTDVGVSANMSGNLVSGSWYRFVGWVRVDAGSMSFRRVQGILPLMNKIVPSSGGAYVMVSMFDKANANSSEAIGARQIGPTVAATFYVDDQSLKLLTLPSLFLVRKASSSDMIVNATVTIPASVFFGTAGVVASLDNPNDPLNYVRACLYGSTLNMDKVVAGVITNLITTTAVPLENGELPEIRKSGTTYQLWYRGMQVGANQTVSDAGIVNNLWAGVIDDAGATFGSFSVRRNGTNYTPSWAPMNYGGATYPAGNGVLSLRFDDVEDRTYTYAYPLLTARSLTAGFAPMRKNIGISGYATLAQVLAMQTAGMEIMCHSRTHGNDPADYATFLDETATAGEEMRLLGIKIDSFVQPGTWSAAYNFDNINDIGTAGDQLLRQYFACYEAYIRDPDRTLPIPAENRYAACHITGDTMSLVALKAQIDSTIAAGQGIEILFHAANIGLGGANISEADFTEFLDYVKTKVDTGTLTVLTPTQQLFAQPV